METQACEAPGFENGMSHHVIVWTVMKLVAKDAETDRGRYNASSIAGQDWDSNHDQAS